MPLTLYEKIFNRHVVREDNDTYLIYIDRHLIHEVTSPQAFEGLRIANRPIWRTNSILAVPDHNVPTTDRKKGILDPISKIQVDTLDSNCDEYKLTQFKMNDQRQGIVHVIGPEQGSTLPGMTIVCGDSHTSTHGAFGALAIGIGTSEVEHVLATQCLIVRKFKTMQINVNGSTGEYITAKDIALDIIGKIGTAGGTGYAIEFSGSAIRDLSMEGRMTLCNMAIEAGSRAGLVGVDLKTINYLKDRPFSPKGELWKQAVDNWKELISDKDAIFDKVIDIDQSPIGRTPRSNPATYTGIFTGIRELFAGTQESRSRGYKVGRFSFNVKGGRCEACQGDGVIKVEMHFLPDVYVPCDVCKGQRYNRETLEVQYKGKNIHQVLEMTVEDAHDYFDKIPAIARKLKTLMDVGLSYIRLGQAATTLSGGEAQRVKLARELSKRDTGKTLYILDEPTTGLHFADIEQLLVVLHRLRDHGNTIVVIEHNLDVIKTADWIIDLGPEGGAGGGEILIAGTPDEVAECERSHTGHYLKPLL